MTSKSTRRAILAGAAALPALAVPAIAAPIDADPILAAIDAHKRAYAELDRLCCLQNKLEQTIPAERRMRHYVGDRDNAEMIAGDDPAWTKYQDACFTANDVADNRAVDLLNVAPTSIAGVAALLDYVAAFEKRDGDLFPQITEENSDDPLTGIIACVQWCADCLREIKT
jgi:hypothetical protein